MASATDVINAAETVTVTVTAAVNSAAPVGLSHPEAAMLINLLEVWANVLGIMLVVIGVIGVIFGWYFGSSAKEMKQRMDKMVQEVAVKKSEVIKVLDDEKAGDIARPQRSENAKTEHAKKVENTNE